MKITSLLSSKPKSLAEQQFVAPDLSEMQRLYKQAVEDTGPKFRPEVVAAYMQAKATLAVSHELKSIRLALMSGECGLTVGIEPSK